MRVEIDAMKYARTVTFRFKIKRMREFKLRIWLALLTFRLGTWISGCNFQYDGLEEVSDAA